MYNLEGIVIKTIDYKESSQIVYLYTNRGIDSFLARGSKKNVSSLKGACELMNRISYTKTNSKGLSTLINYDILNSYSNAKKDLAILDYVNIIFEACYKLKENINYQTAYSFLVITLDKINDGFDYRILTDIFLVKYLYLLGVNPYLKNCVICNKSSVVGLSIEKGGLVCQDHCDETTCYSISLISYIAKCYYTDINKIDFSYDENCLKFIVDYYKYHLNYQFKSIEMLEKFELL